MATNGVIYVVGTTGVGKSQLAIDLALALGGPARSEVVNADSMQVYRGLDVLTNKVTPEEMRGVPHRLLGFVEPGEEYQVGQFVQDAEREIQRCHGQGKTPVVAGGTAYYVQTLLFPARQVETRLSTPIEDPLLVLSENEAMRGRLVRLSADQLDLLRALPSLPNTPSPTLLPPDFPYDLLPPCYRSPEAIAEGFHATLAVLDPDMAQRWHPRNIRKTRRSLEICLGKGKPASEVMAEQDEADTAQARYPTLIFWLKADDDVLSERLDKRVDKMVENGLLAEVDQLRTDIESHARKDDVTSGIFQAIGYREMTGYLSPPCTCSPAASHPRLDTEEARLAHAIDRTKTSTRQYAKRQTSWLERKLLPQLAGEERVHLCVLDATRVEEWEERVRRPATEVMQAWQNGHDLSNAKAAAVAMFSSTATALAPSAQLASQRFIECETCSTATGRPVRVAPSQLDTHLKSKGHRHHASPRAFRRVFEDVQGCGGMTEERATR